MRGRVFILFLVIIALNGCMLAKKGVYLLPEERIYTLKAGKPISVLLDKKPLDITFVEDMKIVHPSILIRQEEKLNSETLKKIKAERSKGNIIKISGSIFAILAGLIGYLKKKK